MSGALFLDRDGFINQMVKYSYGWDSPQKPQAVRLVKDIEKVILWANQNKLLVVEASNQAGAAVGKMSQKTSEAIEKRVHQLLKQRGVYIDRAYICPHYPEAVVPKLKKVCNCRKPKPGLLLKAAKELDIDLSKSLFVGDNATDVEAAKNAGAKSLIYLHGEDVPEKVRKAKLVNADYKAASIKEVLQITKSFFKSK